MRYSYAGHVYECTIDDTDPLFLPDPASHLRVGDARVIGVPAPAPAADRAPAPGTPGSVARAVQALEEAQAEGNINKILAAQNKLDKAQEAYDKAAATLSSTISSTLPVNLVLRTMHWHPPAAHHGPKRRVWAV